MPAIPLTVYRHRDRLFRMWNTSTRTVVKATQGSGPFSSIALLTLDCGHITSVPQDDEESLSFVGAETECSEQHCTKATDGFYCNADAAGDPCSDDCSCGGFNAD